MCVTFALSEVKCMSRTEVQLDIAWGPLQPKMLVFERKVPQTFSKNCRYHSPWVNLRVLSKSFAKTFTRPFKFCHVVSCQKNSCFSWGISTPQANKVIRLYIWWRKMNSLVSAGLMTRPCERLGMKWRCWPSKTMGWCCVTFQFLCFVRILRVRNRNKCIWQGQMRNISPRVCLRNDEFDNPKQINFMRSTFEKIQNSIVSLGMRWAPRCAWNQTAGSCLPPTWYGTSLFPEYCVSRLHDVHALRLIIWPIKFASLRWNRALNLISFV